MNGEQYFESTKTTSKELAKKIWKRREGEIAMGLFKIGWPGERMTFGLLCEEFERAHFAGLTENTVRGHRSSLSNLKLFFGDRKLDNITVAMVEAYRDERRQQPSKHKPNPTQPNREWGDGQSRTRVLEVHAGLCHEAKVHRREPRFGGQTLQ